jgi:hypothetical protein
MCPPGTDQTERVRQEWHLIAPRLRKRICFGGPYFTHTAAKIETFLFDPMSSWGAWGKLAKPSAGHISAFRSPVRMPVSQEPRTIIESLPAEVLAMILDNESLSKEDVLCFGLAYQNLWPHVLYHIIHDCRKHRGSLTGIEIALTGTWLTDLPESFLEPELTIPDSTWRYPYPARGFNWTAWRSWEGFDKEVEAQWISAWNVGGPRKAKISQVQEHQMLTELMRVTSPVYGYPTNQGWVLRNLISKEYVRCKPGPTVPLQHGYVDHVDFPSLRIDDVLLMRIGWSRRLSWERCDEAFDRLVRGPWAGHCFDIVPLDETLNTDSSWKDWMDSTDQIVREARDFERQLNEWPAVQNKRRKMKSIFKPQFGGTVDAYGI